MAISQRTLQDFFANVRHETNVAMKALNEWGGIYPNERDEIDAHIEEVGLDVDGGEEVL